VGTVKTINLNNMKAVHKRATFYALKVCCYEKAVLGYGFL
jgi:hypothetical protein